MPLSTSVQVTAGIVHGRIFEQLKFGDVVGTINATVIHYTHQRDSEPGFYAYGVALCHYVHGIGEYVIWQLIFDHERDEWLCQSGQYPATFEEAIAMYQERANDD